MKRIELVMDNLALDAFRHTAAALGIEEFELIEVMRSSPHYFENKRFYRGQSYTLELSPRAKVKISWPITRSQRIVRVLSSGIRSDSISVFAICQLVQLDGETTAGSALSSGDRDWTSKRSYLSAIHRQTRTKNYGQYQWQVRLVLSH